MSTTTSMPQSHFLSLLEPITQNMPPWFQAGGFIMWSLLLISFLITIVVLERVCFWIIYHRQKERFFLQECFAALYQQQKTDALLACQKLDTPALTMLRESISILPFSPKDKMFSDSKKQISLLSKGQSFLHSAIIVTPILGILGALISLINTFSAISIENSENTVVLLKAVTESLIPITASLIILLFAFIAQQIFRSQIHKVSLHFVSVRILFDHVCQQKNLIKNNVAENLNTMAKQDDKAISEESEEYLSKSVSEQTHMPYHYEFSEETGEVNVSLHEQTEDIKRVSSSSIAEMYDKKMLSTEDESMSIEDELEASENKLTDSEDKLLLTDAESTVSENKLTGIEDEQLVTNDESTVSENKLTGIEDEPLVTNDESTAFENKLTDSEDKPLLTDDGLTVSENKLADIEDKPLLTDAESAASENQLTDTEDKPLLTDAESAASENKLTDSEDKPLLTDAESTAIVK
jgi:biopolymer transport protein ExbB/TolQ